MNIYHVTIHLTLIKKKKKLKSSTKHLEGKCSMYTLDNVINVK